MIVFQLEKKQQCPLKININKARPMQMGLDRGKAAQSRKTASLKVERPLRVFVHKKK